MSKKDRQAVRESLANALEPPRKPPQKQNLDKLFEEFDDGKPLSTPVTSVTSVTPVTLATPITPVTPVTPLSEVTPATPEAINVIKDGDREEAWENKIENEPTTNKSNSDEVDLPFTPSATSVTTVTPVTPVTRANPSKRNTQTTPVTPVDTKSLDATHSPSEQQVYSVMYRQTITQGKEERHFGVTELLKLTGIQSDKTIRKAIDGLLAKMSIELISYRPGDPKGPLYKINTPRSIFDLRSKHKIEIEPLYKKVLSTPVTPVTGVTAVNITPVTPVDFAGVTGVSHDHDLNNQKIDDDDCALRAMLRSFFPDQDQQIEKALTEIKVSLATELRDRAARASTTPISPAYFIQIVKNLCSASNRPDKPERSETSHTSPSQPNSSRSAGKTRLRVIIDRLRQAHIGGNYSLGELAEDTKIACVRDGVTFDNDIFNEIIAEKSRSGN